jgi:hypothetical protein
VELGFLDTPGWAFDVAVVGTLAYMADRDSGLRVIDVSNPASPVELGFVDTPGSAYDVEVVGDFAYVADYRDGGLRVIDVSNPASPVEVGFLEKPGFALDVEVVGDLAYVGFSSSINSDRGLWVIDISSPASPMEVGFLDTSGIPYGLAVVGTLAYVVGGPSGVRVIDVSNPASPVVELGAFDTPDHASDVAVVGTVAYVGDSRSGLRIIDFGPEYAGALAVEIDIKPGSDFNSINPFSRGVVPVAIFGSEDFDVAGIDLTRLTFGIDDALPAIVGRRHRDVNADGFPDLLSHFRTAEIGIEIGDTEACLSGETLDGTPFSGCDTIRTVPDR